MNRRLLWIGALCLVGIAAVLVWRSAERAIPARIEDPVAATHSPALEEPALLDIEHDRTSTSRSEVRPGKAAAVAQATQRPTAQHLVLDGRVVDDLGQTVSGIEVMARPLGEGRPGREVGAASLRELLDARIDVAFSWHDGSFRVEGLEPGEWELVATSGKRRSAPVVVTLPDDRAPTTLVLPRTAAVAGIVVDASARLVSAAEVHLVVAGEEHAIYGIFGRPQPCTRTDSLGRFRIENVQPGKVHLMASQANQTESAWIEVVLPPGGIREDVRIELLAGGRIEGWLDPSLGQLARREIHLNSFDGTLGWRRTETDDSGRFALDGVIPQAYCISLMQTTTAEEVVAGEAHIVTTTSGQIRKNVVVVAGQTVEVVFGGQEATILVRGTITSAGQPVPDAEVGAAPQDGTEETGSRAKTTMDGTYELSVPRAGDYAFEISVDRGSLVYFPRTVPALNLVELSFSVPSGAISGRVVDDEGRALARVPVTAVLESDALDFYSDRYRRLYTNDDGTFAFRLLAPGTYTLRAPDGFQSDSPPPRVPHGRLVLTDVQVGDSELTNVELRLPPEGRVSGTVVDGIGAPVPDAFIYLTDERGWPISGDWEARTDSSGHFLIESVAPGVHTAWVQAKETETESSPFQVEAGKTASIRVELR